MPEEISKKNRGLPYVADSATLTEAEILEDDMKNTALEDLCEQLRAGGASWSELGELLGLTRAQARRKALGERAPSAIEEALARALLAACEPRAPRDLRRLLEGARSRA